MAGVRWFIDSTPTQNGMVELSVCHRNGEFQLSIGIDDGIRCRCTCCHVVVKTRPRWRVITVRPASTDACTHIKTHAYTLKHALTHTHLTPRTGLYTHTDIQTHAHTLTQTLMHTHTQTPPPHPTPTPSHWNYNQRTTTECSWHPLKTTRTNSQVSFQSVLQKKMEVCWGRCGIYTHACPCVCVSYTHTLNQYDHSETTALRKPFVSGHSLLSHLLLRYRALDRSKFGIFSTVWHSWSGSGVWKWKHEYINQICTGLCKVCST